MHSTIPHQSAPTYAPIQPVFLALDFRHALAATSALLLQQVVRAKLAVIHTVLQAPHADVGGNALVAIARVVVIIARPIRHGVAQQAQEHWMPRLGRNDSLEAAEIETSETGEMKA